MISRSRNLFSLGSFLSPVARFLKKRPGEILKPEIGLHQNCTALQPGPGAPPHPGRCPWAAPIVKIWGENGRRRILFWRRRFFYLGSTVFKLGSAVFVFQIVPSLYQNYTTVLPKLYHRCSPQYVEQCMVFWCFDKLFGDFYFILRGLFWGGVGF